MSRSEEKSRGAKFRTLEKVVTTRLIPAEPPMHSGANGTIVQVSRFRGQPARYQVDFDDVRLWCDEDALELV